ncbi:MAG: hypothetical protein N3A67_00875 [Ignavibacteria bacterium]|jgi:hypothetical protein|nr:hypothetical protein [Ignavibacteria bacterium]
MSRVYEVLKDMLNSVEEHEWNTNTSCYYLGRIHMAFEWGLITEEERNDLRKKLRITQKEIDDIAW